ncbi:MAG: N-acetylmuramoyl-L-alanine amidase, partial [Candidatus Gastranaerophilales bacterium]|nr:N-acetylmuramoyl-L-alanine amidase [Candidatus Gastranaerophilales bacterium]
MNLLNNFKHFIIIIITAIALFAGFYAFAECNCLVIVYPKNNSTINANSTFFVGHTHPKAVLTINNEPVKVYSNGSFVRVFALNKGNNEIILKSVLNNEIKEEKFNLTVPIPSKSTTSTKPQLQPLNQIMIVNDKEAPLRKTPYGDRMTPLKKGVVVEVVGLINDHYKVKLSDNNFAYIGKSVLIPYDKEKIKLQNLSEVQIFGDEKNVFVKIPMEQPVLTEIFINKNNLKIKLHGTHLEFKDYIVKSPYVKDFNFNNDTINISMNMDNLFGYDYFYENNTFILKIRKPLKGGLRGKTITIDPGHGGKECGSIGPTETKEKDINLQISKYLKHELEKEGAKVIMTRTKDCDVEIYKRVDIAQDNDSDILISIHNNALPDGQNPYEIHGTTTYYYNEQAINLANKIQNNLVKTTGFRNQGIKHASFVLTRPTMPVSVLIEVGFMINPYEYANLL